LKKMLDGSKEGEYNCVLWFGWQVDKELAKREDL